MKNTNLLLYLGKALLVFLLLVVILGMLVMNIHTTVHLGLPHGFAVDSIRQSDCMNLISPLFCLPLAYISNARPYSTINPAELDINDQPVESSSLIPVVTYPDAFLNKSVILKNSNNKAGIYRWVNKVNGNTYIGSSVNLTTRFRKYYSFRNISSELVKGKSMIYSAILKYGYLNFQLEILEYCTAENVISREQYYIDLLKPEYNILTTAGSRLGTKHSEESRLKMSQAAQGRKLTEQTKKLLSLANKGLNNPNFGKTHSKEVRALITLAKIGKSFLSESMKARMSADSGTALKVVDLKTNETSVYTSIKKAAEAMGVTHPAISKRLSKHQGSFIVKKRYQVEKVNETK